MSDARAEQWISAASSTLSKAGFRMGAVRRSVLELLAEHGCALSAREEHAARPQSR